MSKRPRQNSGFTLIELSIVLVIIGLIIGGVMVGRDLISAATIRSQISQIQNLQTQINTFRGKYGCLPGDCSTATQFFGTVDSAGHTIANGDGDEIIHSTVGGGGPYDESNCLSPNEPGEVTQLFLHLNDAGLGNYGSLDGASATVGHGFPYSAYGNGTGVYITCLSYSTDPTYIPAFLSTGNIMIIGNGGPISYGRIGYSIGIYGLKWYGVYGNTGFSPVYPIGLPIYVLQNIDAKIDDGLPNSGSFGIVAGAVGCDTTITKPLSSG